MLRILACALCLACCALPDNARAAAPVLLFAEPASLETCRTLEVELRALDIDVELIEASSLDPAVLEVDSARTAIVLCRMDPPRIEIFRGGSEDPLTRSPDHVATIASSGPAAATVEASEWLRALLLDLPALPEARPAATADEPRVAVAAPRRRPTILLATPYLYASRPLRSIGVAAGVSYPVLPSLALAVRLTAEARPARTIRAQLPYRVRTDRLELGGEYVTDLGGFGLRAGLYLGGTRIAVHGFDGEARERRGDARILGTGLLRFACVYAVSRHVALGLETDVGLLFREIEIAQIDTHESIGRFVGTLGARIEVRP